MRGPRLHRRPRAARREGPGRRSRRSRSSTAQSRRAWSTAARRWCARGSSPSSAARSTCRRGGKKYFNTTPLGRAVTTTAIIRAMREDGVHVFGDGSTHKGNDIQRFYRYGILDQPGAQDLQAVARSEVRRRVRRPQGDERVPGEASACPTRWAPRRRTAPTPTCSARRTRPRTSSTSTRACASSSRSWASRLEAPRSQIEPEEVTVTFERGVPVALNGKRFDSLVELFLEANRIGGRHGLGHERPDREPRHRRQEPRHLRGAGHGAAPHRLRAPAVARSTTRTRSTSTSRSAAASAACSTRASGSTPRRCCSRTRSRAGSRRASPAQVTLELRRGDDYTILDTRAEYMAYAPTSCRWRRSRKRLHAGGPHRRARAAEPVGDRQPRVPGAPPGKPGAARNGQRRAAGAARRAKR